MNNDDLISRQAAIERFGEDWTWLERQGVTTISLVEAKQRAIDLLESFPSAEPVYGDLVIKDAYGIKDGLYNVKDGKMFMYKAKGGTVRPYDVVPFAEPVHGEDGTLFGEVEDVDKVNRVIVEHEKWCKTFYQDSEPVHGKWIQISPARIYECSVCGQNVMTDDIVAYTFCHRCGAKMDGR